MNTAKKTKRSWRFFTAEPLGGKYHRRSSNRQFAKIIGRDFHEADRILYGKATWKGWKKQDHYLIGKKTDYRLFERTHRFLWYGVRGTIDKKPPANPEALKAKSYPFEKQISTGYGHGGLAEDSLFFTGERWILPRRARLTRRA